MSVNEKDLSKYPAGNWKIPTQPRVSYLGTKDVSFINKLLLNLTKRQTKSSEPINIFKVLAHLNKTLKFYLPYFTSLYKRGLINTIEKEKITLRTAWRLGSIYEYSHHREFLEEQGFSKEVIDSYTEEDSELWDDKLRAIMFAVDDIVANHTVNEENWNNLKKFYNDSQMVEFLMLVGYFIMIGIIIDASGVVMEDYSWLK